MPPHSRGQTATSRLSSSPHIGQGSYAEREISTHSHPCATPKSPPVLPATGRSLLEQEWWALGSPLSLPLTEKHIFRQNYASSALPVEHKGEGLSPLCVLRRYLSRILLSPSDTAHLTSMSGDPSLLNLLLTAPAAGSRFPPRRPHQWHSWTQGRTSEDYRKTRPQRRRSRCRSLRER